MGKINAKLISGRTLDQGATLENKMSAEFVEATAICEMNQKNLDVLGASEGDNVEVVTDFGSAVVKLKLNEGNPDHIAFVPMGPYANAVIGPECGGVGMPIYKGLDADISTTDKEILDVKSLFGVV
ncbi:MAG: molybdopterin dinucleotide binding domain-containing protein [Halobacteriota archaeon]|nr:molybdopterin dinucleotide binding domain-containing protein [Halobacteriota archaeon]